MSNKIFLVIQREFLTRVRKKSFIILTILMPFLMAALVTAPMWLGATNTDVATNDMATSDIATTDIATAAGYFLTFLIYMFVLSYGSMVMQGVMEEKTSRIMELMVSSVKPFEMMMGKILGILCVGLFQMLIWFVTMVIFLLVLAAVMGDGSLISDIAMMKEVWSMVSTLPLGEMTLMFVLYFLGGYILYTSYFAACGAAVNSQEDSGMFMTPMIFVMIFAMYAAMGSAENTNGPLAVWTSLFPLTSPIVMMIRIPFGVALWEEIVSLVILYATAFLCVAIGAKIYRVGILMYGKKPSLKEMWKWIKFK